MGVIGGFYRTEGIARETGRFNDDIKVFAFSGIDKVSKKYLLIHPFVHIHILTAL